MIEAPTVLILGAGSSSELGFPLGEALNNDICALIKNESEGFHKNPGGNVKQHRISNADLLLRLLELSGEKRNDGSAYSISFIKDCADLIRRTSLPSIDEFLRRRPEFSLLGKICITLKMLEIEKEEESTSWGWYGYLWQKLVERSDTDFERLKKNKLKIITFNYDRSLEHFLISRMAATFKLAEKETVSFFNSVSITHVFGEIGLLYQSAKYVGGNKDLPDEFITYFRSSPIKALFRLFGEAGRFGPHADELDRGGAIFGEEVRLRMAKMLIEIAKQIKTYHEISGDERFADTLKGAQRIYFLGCGYHEQNIQALGLKPGMLAPNIKIYGTAFGLTDLEVDKKRRHVESFSNQRNIIIKNQWIGISERKRTKITEFFRNVAPL